MSAHGHEARVATLPMCDFCADDKTKAPVPASHDGRTAYGWAYMCEAHFAEHGPGRTGLGIAQRLVVTPSPEPDPDCAAAVPAT